MRYLYKYVYDKRTGAYKIYNIKTEVVQSYAHTIAEAIDIVNTLNLQYRRNGRNPLTRV